MVGAKLKIMLDLDGTINYAPRFFALFTKQMKDVAEIHVVTARLDPEHREITIQELKDLNITYDILAITYEKLEYVRKNKISIVFEDCDEFFKEMPPEVLVFKIREEENFDWKRKKWIYDNETGVHIEDL